MKKLLNIICLSIGILSVAVANESDRITDFKVDIEVLNNGLIKVKESITIFNGNVDALNNQIQRGIVRDFPTVYTDKNGLRSQVAFDILDITLDGSPEPYFTERLKNGIRIYIGRESVYLPRGFFTYTIEYKTDRQIIYHQDKDELYWNVTGSGWAFKIEKASCIIHFPNASRILEQACYTGSQGSTESACQYERVNDHTIRFFTDATLQEEQGLTVAAAIEKGVLTEPDKSDLLIMMLKDNFVVPALLLAIILLFIAHYRSWKKMGKDPEKGVIIPQFAPPEGMSPADVGYVLTQSYSGNLFAAAIVDMAVKRYLDIEVGKEGLLFKSQVYSFKRPPLVKHVSVDHELYQWYGFEPEDLFGQEAKAGEYNKILASRYSSLHDKLKERVLVRSGVKNTFKGIFSLNDNYVGLGIFYLFLIGMGTVVFLAMFPSPMLVALSAILFVIGIIIQVVFMRIMSAYTLEGRKIADHIEGFKLYLETAEVHVFDMLNPPEMNLQLFEKYLPYAIALNCEHQWSEKFENIIDKAIASGYEPAYYRGFSHSNFNAAAFSSGISSGLSQTVSSSITPPSSSGGGSSGGGSSGGGGGGGGGGGW